jgi:periplasmic copper chaperone A
MHKIKLLILSFSLFLTCFVFANENINISELWISEAPPTASVLAAYARIQNTSEKEQTLILITSPIFSKIELHLSKIANGMATMKKHNSLIIPAKSFIELSPGSYHLMLFNPDTSLKAGDSATITFTFASGMSTSIEAKVKKRNNDEH